MEPEDQKAALSVMVEWRCGSVKKNKLVLERKCNSGCEWCAGPATVEAVSRESWAVRQAVVARSSPVNDAEFFAAMRSFVLLQNPSEELESGDEVPEGGVVIAVKLPAGLR